YDRAFGRRHGVKDDEHGQKKRDQVGIGQEPAHHAARLHFHPAFVSALFAFRHSISPFVSPSGVNPTIPLLFLRLGLSELPYPVSISEARTPSVFLRQCAGCPRPKSPRYPPTSLPSKELPADCFASI